MTTNQLTNAKLAEALKYLKQPEYGASFLIIKRPGSLEGFETEKLLKSKKKEKGAILRESESLLGSHTTSFLSFWQATKHKKNSATGEIPVIQQGRELFKSNVIKITSDTLYLGSDRSDTSQLYLLFSRLRKRAIWQMDLHNQAFTMLTNLSTSSKEIDRFNLNRDHFVIASVFETTS